jgi:predicted dehydrogenase
MRFGVVGTGYWAREVHAAGVAAHPDAELVGVWGRDPVKADAVAGQFGARAYADLDAMVDAVDAVAFSVPPQVQAELAPLVARAGRHLLLEKPLAIGVAAADAVVDAVAEAGVASVVFFTDRFIPAAEAWLESTRGALGGSALWLASLQTPGNPFAGSPWRQVEGALWDVGPHALAALLPVLGPVREVTGARGPGDLVHLVLAHESGAVSTAALSLTMPPDATRFAVEFYREDGWHARPGREGDSLPYGNALGELIGLVRDGRREHRCDVRFARDVVAILDQAERALGEPAATA